MNEINFTNSQVKSYENGKVIYFFFADLYRLEAEEDISILPLKVGDKDVYIRNENIDDSPLYKLNEIINVKNMRIQDVSHQDKIKFWGTEGLHPTRLIEKFFIQEYNNQLQEQNINRTHEDNDYIFLVEIKK